MNGVLNINKPAGPTSFDVVARVRRLSGEKRVGHGGTLDPAATGVLVVCLGQGTRLIEYLIGSTKTYRAGIELGVATDTHDATGRVIQQGDVSGISRQQLVAVLKAFRGPIQQTPPMHSALKYRGRPLYKLARAGITVELTPRPVQIHRLELLDWQPPVVTVEIESSKGTYIRSLAHDLGRVLGCGAHLKSLVRLKCGIFDIKDSVSLPQLEDAFLNGCWQKYLYPPDSILSHWKAVVLSDGETRDIKNGSAIALETGGGLPVASVPELPNSGSAPPEDWCRAYAPDGRFLAVLRFRPEQGLWHPEKVFL